ILQQSRAANRGGARQIGKLAARRGARVDEDIDAQIRQRRAHATSLRRVATAWESSAWIASRSAVAKVPGPLASLPAISPAMAITDSAATVARKASGST